MNTLRPGKESGSLRARVFAALEQAIINGEYKEGDSMNEIKLSQQLGVSRTPVREALMQLELEGLVETIQNKGAVVVGVSPRDIEDIYAIRMHLEGFAAELAAKNMDDRKAFDLSKIVDLQEFYITKQDTEAIRKLDADFHNAIYDATDNRSLCSLLTNFHNQIQRGRGLSLKVSGRSEKSVMEHRAIADAIVAHDAELAGRLMYDHINNALKNFREEVEAKQDLND